MLKKDIVKIIVVILACIILASIILLYIYEKNTDDKQAIMDILEIKDAGTFKLIYVKPSFELQTNDGSYYEIKFEISLYDYKNNNLNYSEEPYTELLECSYKELKDENTYMCIRRISNLYNEELYDKIRSLNIGIQLFK